MDMDLDLEREMGGEVGMDLEMGAVGVVVFQWGICTEMGGEVVRVLYTVTADPIGALPATDGDNIMDEYEGYYLGDYGDYTGLNLDKYSVYCVDEYYEGTGVVRFCMEEIQAINMKGDGSGYGYYSEWATYINTQGDGESFGSGEYIYDEEDDQGIEIFRWRD
jgi:hypothetical protein